MSAYPVSPLDNLDAPRLADEFGELNVEIKRLQDRQKALRERLIMVDSTERELDGSIAGERYRVTMVAAMRWSLNTADIRREMGQDWYDRHSSAAVVTTVTATPRKAA